MYHCNRLTSHCCHLHYACDFALTSVAFHYIHWQDNIRLDSFEWLAMCLMCCWFAANHQCITFNFNRYVYVVKLHFIWNHHNTKQKFFLLNEVLSYTLQSFPHLTVLFEDHSKVWITPNCQNLVKSARDKKIYSDMETAEHTHGQYTHTLTHSFPTVPLLLDRGPTKATNTLHFKSNTKVPGNTI